MQNAPPLSPRTRGEERRSRTRGEERGSRTRGEERGSRTRGEERGGRTRERVMACIGVARGGCIAVEGVMLILLGLSLFRESQFSPLAQSPNSGLPLPNQWRGRNRQGGAEG